MWSTLSYFHAPSDVPAQTMTPHSSGTRQLELGEVLVFLHLIFNACFRRVRNLASELRFLSVEQLGAHVIKRESKMNAERAAFSGQPK